MTEMTTGELITWARRAIDRLAACERSGQWTAEDRELMHLAIELGAATRRVRRQRAHFNSRMAS